MLLTLHLHTCVLLHTSQTPRQPGVVWLKHFHLIGGLWRQILERFSCLMAAPALSLWELRARVPAVCGVTCFVPIQTAIATRVGQKATPVARTPGWGCACANPTSRAHTATNVPQATMDPAASVSTQWAVSPGSPDGLLLVLHPCWGGGIAQLHFQVTNSHDFCTFAVVFHPALTLQHPPRLWGCC